METGSKLKDLPVVSDAFGKGQISYDHARIIAKTAERVNIDEQELVDLAKVQPVDVFAGTARKHERDRSGDNGVSRLEQQRQERCGRIKTDPADGMTVLWARFDPVTGARIKTVLSTRTNQMWRAEDPQMRLRPEQRMADALVELLCNTSHDKSHTSGGATLLLIADYDTVSQQIENARLGDGTPVPVEMFKDLACDTRILPAIFDAKGQPLWVGRAKRLATCAQRISLIARDRGCVGCGADPSWCQAHRVIAWSAGGQTDVDNLVLLCSRCHHRVHDQNWQIQPTPPREPHPSITTHQQPPLTHQQPTPPPWSPSTHHQTAAVVKTPHQNAKQTPPRISRHSPAFADFSWWRGSDCSLMVLLTPGFVDGDGRGVGQV